jgi:hypothetical protein
MRAKTWYMVILIAITGVWTLFAWGASTLLNALPVLLDAARNATEQQAPLSLSDVIPSNVVDAVLPVSLLLWQNFSDTFPVLTLWAGYLVWIIWAMGVVFFLAITWGLSKLRYG